MWKIEWRELGGWADAGWTIDDKPMRFKTKKEAEDEIDEFIHGIKTERINNPDGLDYDRADYRAVKETSMNKTKRPTDKQYLAAAKALYEKEGELEFDEKSGTQLVSKARGNPDKGAYIQCWRFIYDDDVRAVTRGAKRAR